MSQQACLLASITCAVKSGIRFGLQIAFSGVFLLTPSREAYRLKPELYSPTGKQHRTPTSPSAMTTALATELAYSPRSRLLHGMEQGTRVSMLEMESLSRQPASNAEPSKFSGKPGNGCKSIGSNDCIQSTKQTTAWGVTWRQSKHESNDCIQSTKQTTAWGVTWRQSKHDGY